MIGIAIQEDSLNIVVEKETLLVIPSTRNKRKYAICINRISLLRIRRVSCSNWLGACRLEGV